MFPPDVYKRQVQDNTTVKELTKVMGDDSVSNEKKTSFLLQYLLDQREPLLRFGQTLLIALIVFVIGRKTVSYTHLVEIIYITDIGSLFCHLHFFIIVDVINEFGNLGILINRI